MSTLHVWCLHTSLLAILEPVHFYVSSAIFNVVASEMLLSLSWIGLFLQTSIWICDSHFPQLFVFIAKNCRCHIRVEHRVEIFRITGFRSQFLSVLFSLLCFTFVTVDFFYQVRSFSDIAFDVTHIERFFCFCLFYNYLLKRPTYNSPIPKRIEL